MQVGRSDERNIWADENKNKRITKENLHNRISVSGRIVPSFVNIILKREEF